MTSPDRPTDQQSQDVESPAPEQAQTSHSPASNEPQTSASALTLEADPRAPTTENDDEDELEIDDGDSAVGTDKSDSTSISSSIYQGYLEHGRRYQTTREGEFFMPHDEKQFECWQAAHIVYMILDSQQKNPLFRSPIPDTVQNILDVGTGNGEWAREVADRYPGALVQGVDLYPPPDTWVPPNCKLEVDDVLKPWDFQHKFALVHMRDLQGSFTDRQWTGVYKQAYENLLPGGWIEDVQASVGAYSDDRSFPKDSLIEQSGPLFSRFAQQMGKPFDSIDKSKARIEAAGFKNIQEKWYKVPLGEWVKNPLLKEAGKFCKTQVLEGLEGYCMFLFTKFGEPTPWTPEEVQVWLAKYRKEIDTPGMHAYYLKRRVWGQKPYDSEPKAEQKTEVENLE